MPYEVHDDKIIMRAGEYNRPKPWVGLTDAEIEDTAQHYTESEGFRHGAIWAQEKLKEKNHA